MVVAKDPWLIVHRARATAHAFRVARLVKANHPAYGPAFARLAYYYGKDAPSQGPGHIAWHRAAGREGYENRSWRSHHSSPTPALPQYNDSDAKRKGES